MTEIVALEYNDKKGYFYVMIEDKIEAKMTFVFAGKDKIIIDHTEVDDELRGKNVGYQLVHTAVEYARSNHIKILPLCPFAKSVFDKKMTEFGDVLRGK